MKLVDRYEYPSDLQDKDVHAPGAAFTREEVAEILDPNSGKLLPGHRTHQAYNNGDERHEDLRRFLNKTPLRTRADFGEGGIKYCTIQQELEKVMDHSGFIADMGEDGWDALGKIPDIEERLEVAKKLRSAWEERQVLQATQEMEALDQANLPSKAGIYITKQALEDDKVAYSITFTGGGLPTPSRKTVVATATAATLAVATAAGVTDKVIEQIKSSDNGGQVLETDPYKDYAKNERPDKKKDKPLPELSPYSIDKKDPSEIAADDYDLKPDQRIPKKVKSKMVSKTIKSAMEEARATANNPVLQNNEPDKTQLTRKDEEVRNIDSMARYIIKRHAADSSLTPRELDMAKRGAVQAMTAARFPTSYISPAGSFKPATRFQKSAAKDIDRTIFKGKSNYSSVQQEYIATTIAKTLDDTTPKSHNKHALAGFESAVKKIAGIKRNSTHTQEKGIKNPEYRLVEALAAVSIIESGIPADPDVENAWGYYGPWQISPKIWHHKEAGWAKMYLGDAKAPMSIDNMVKVTLLRWKDMVDSLGSIDAAAAEWLKGPRTGRIVAGSDRKAYMAAMGTADGNNTSVRQYTKKIAKHIGNVDVYEQLRFLAKVKDRNPDFDWDILDKKAPLHSKIRMNELRASKKRQLRADRARAAAKPRKSKSKKPKETTFKANPLDRGFSSKHKSNARQNITQWRRQAGSSITRAAEYEFKLNGFKDLEGKPNTGPQVRKYTGGPQGVKAPWCAWFVSYVNRKGHHEFKGWPADKNGNISYVGNLRIWYQKHGIQFSARSKTLSPRPGDTIMFGNEHTGVVSKTGKGWVEYIDGNGGRSRFTSEGDSVTKRRINITGSSTIDFGRHRGPSR